MSKLKWMTKACGVFLLWAATAVALPAQTFTTIYSFDGTVSYEPTTALVQATNGALYGTTSIGGTSNAGSIFKITTGGTLTTVWIFCSEYFCTDGARPNGLIQGTDGGFYGTTTSGGGYNDGTVFKITSGGTLTILHTFTGTGPEGYSPLAGLVQGTDGEFYGATVYGAAYNVGGVFKITPSGNLTALRDFNGMNGAYLAAPMIQGNDGSLYGTSYYGGAMGFCTLSDGCGTAFKITTGGPLTVLYPFCSQSNCADGQGPEAGVVQGTDGNLYGTTQAGGTNNAGTVFKLTPGGTLTTLYNFCSQGGSSCTDGSYPFAALIQGSDGNFYGITPEGGANSSCNSGYGCGTIFKITPSGTLTTLHNFCSQGGSSCTDGFAPYASLTQDTNGTFYGTTQQGGANICEFGNGCGTIYGLSVGLGPFVKTQPASGPVGAAVKILGTNLTGATSVSFNGTAATFTVISGSEITTTVPAGASTGKVQVTVPKGTLTSNVRFRVN